MFLFQNRFFSLKMGVSLGVVSVC